MTMECPHLDGQVNDVY